MIAVAQERASAIIDAEAEFEVYFEQWSPPTSSNGPLR
jgi:hypothetical protein